MCRCRLSCPYSRRLRLSPIRELPLAPLFTPSILLSGIFEPAGSTFTSVALSCALLSRFPSRCRKRRRLAVIALLNTTFHRWRRRTTLHSPRIRPRPRSRRSRWEARREGEQQQHRSSPGRRAEFTCSRPGHPLPPGPSFRRGTARYSPPSEPIRAWRRRLTPPTTTHGPPLPDSGTQSTTCRGLSSRPHARRIFRMKICRSGATFPVTHTRS